MFCKNDEFGSVISIYSLSSEIDVNMIYNVLLFYYLKFVNPICIKQQSDKNQRNDSELKGLTLTFYRHSHLYQSLRWGQNVEN